MSLRYPFDIVRVDGLHFSNKPSLARSPARIYTRTQRVIEVSGEMRYGARLMRRGEEKAEEEERKASVRR